MPPESAVLDAPPATRVDAPAPHGSLDRDLTALARDARAATGWSLAQVWRRMRGPRGEWLELIASDHGGSPATCAFETVSRGGSARQVDPFLARVVELGRPVWVDRLRSASGSPRSGAARAAGLGPAACVPIVAGDEVVGVLEVLGPRGCSVEADLVFMLARMARGAGAWTHQRALARGSRATRPALPLDRLAHDFNDVLTVVAACSSASLERLHDRELMREALAAILDCVDPATALVKELLSGSDDPTRGVPVPPQGAASRPTLGEPSPEASRQAFGGTVLVVEDEPVVRALTASLLRRWGYFVIEAASGEQAIQMMGESDATVDLLLTDVILPGLSGPALHGRLLDLRPGLPVVYFSGYVPERIARDVVIPPESFLAKPFTAESLRVKVQQALAR